MLRRTFCCLALLLASSSSVASAIELDFTAAPSALLHFNGSDQFSFTPASSGAFAGSDFFIYNSTGSGDSVPDKGTISGTYTFTTPPSGPGMVTGSGVIDISDGTGHDLKATVDWKTIAVSSTTGAGNLNVNGVVNLSGVTYSGSRTDLQALAAGAMQTATLSFNVKPSQNLSYLGANVTDVRGYTGALTAVPEPGTIAMLFAGIPAVGLVLARRRKIAA